MNIQHPESSTPYSLSAAGRKNKQRPSGSVQSFRPPRHSLGCCYSRLRCSFSRQSVGLLVASVAGVTRNVHLEEEAEEESENNNVQTP